MTRTAIRLLKAMVNEAMAERQADAEDMVGVPVVVSSEAAEAAGINPNRYYDAAVSAAVTELVDEEALVYDRATSQMLARTPAGPAYVITRRGVDLLREAGEL